MNIPYGMGDFSMVRRGGYFYVDKTHFIPRLEDAKRGRRFLLFVRPRRSGKTLFLSMLQHYYDVARKEQFDELFAGLYIARQPTPERSTYLILRLDFAGLTNSQGPEALYAIIARLFMTGVAPIMVNGFNVAKHISLDEDFHDLCGFSQADVEQLLDGVIADQGLTLAREQILSDLRRYYDGYRFTPEGSRLYNPDMVLYFMSGLTPSDHYPRQLLDFNVRTDTNRLYRLLFTADGTPRQRPIELMRTILTEGSILASLHDIFLLDDACDDCYFASYLTYLGLLTIEAEQESMLRLCIPNGVITGIYGEFLRRVLESTTQVKLGQATQKI